MVRSENISSGVPSAIITVRWSPWRPNSASSPCWVMTVPLSGSPCSSDSAVSPAPPVSPVLPAG